MDMYSTTLPHNAVDVCDFFINSLIFQYKEQDEQTVVNTTEKQAQKCKLKAPHSNTPVKPEGI